MQKGVNLIDVPQRKLKAVLRRLQAAGITMGRLLQILDAEDDVMQCLSAAWPKSPGAGIVYDASAVIQKLGMPRRECRDQVPQAEDGEVVIYYGGWDLKALRWCREGMQRMQLDERWCDGEIWVTEPGYYRLRPRALKTEMRNDAHLEAALKVILPGWKRAPVRLAATALLVHLTVTGKDLLQADVASCPERLANDGSIGLCVDDHNFVSVHHCHKNPPDVTCWVFAAKKA